MLLITLLELGENLKTINSNDYCFNLNSVADLQW